MAEQPELSGFEHSLPPGKPYFTLRQLAAIWDCSEDNVQRLIDDGSLELAADIAPRRSVKAMQRVARASVVAFLNSRKAAVFFRERAREKRS